MTLKQRIDQHDREIAAIRKLVLTGMKMLVQLEASQKKTDGQLKILQASQQKTEQTLERFIRSLTHAGNGHSKH